MSLKVNITKFAFLIFWALLMAASSPVYAQYQGCARISQIPIKECEALERFFEQTNGRFWQNNRGWLVSNQPCNWFGLTCTSTSWPRNVVSIKFSVNDISGTLPGEISQFSELRELVIENSQAGVDGEFTQLQGEIPAVLGDLKNLEVLWLSHNKIGQSLSNEIGGMKNLRVLRLDNNLMTGPLPAELGSLLQLEEIDLSNNIFAGRIPPEISELSRLHTLILSDNMMGGQIPVSIGNLGSLRKLDLANNAFSGSIPASITSLKRLNSLMLQGNALQGVLNYYQALQLSALPECHIVEAENQALCLPDFGLSESAFCGLQQDASCGLCAVNDDLPSEACFALEATFRSMGGTTWTDNSLWFSDQPSCSWQGVSCSDGKIIGLSLDDNNLRGSIPADLSLLSNLEFLDLSANSLAGPIPEELGRLTSLDQFDLSDNNLSGVLPLAVAALGAQSSYCEMKNNSTDLCIPVNPDYEIFGPVLCGLEATLSCEPEIFSAIAQFEIQQVGTRLVLTWTLDEPSPELSFRVQQFQQNDFANIGTVISSEGKVDYQFIITQPVSGVSTFRIQMISPSGTLKDGPVLESLFVPKKVLVKGPFPNPSSEQSSLNFALEKSSFVEISLVDVKGRLQRTLLREQIESGLLKSLSFSVAELSSGTYFVQIETETATIVRALQVLR